MKFQETWFGFGFKIGGMLFIVGKESISGSMFNLHNTLDDHVFTISSTRLGLGLGGDASLSVVWVFNTPNIYEFDGKRVEDWGVNLELGLGKLKHASNIVKLNKFLKTIRLLKAFGFKSVEKVAELREAASFFYSLFEIDSSKGPVLHTMDIPFVGGGLEAAAFKTIGEIAIYNSSAPSAPKLKERTFPTRGRNAP